MPPRVFSLFLSGVACVAFCQTPPANRVPDNVLWTEFFGRVMWLDGVGRQIDAKGHDGSDARASTRKQAGLTLAEEAALKSVAQRWKDQDDAILAQVGALHAGGAEPRPQDIERLIAQRRPATLDRVDELKALFGPARFARLNAFVHMTSRVRPPAGASGSRGGR